MTRTLVLLALTGCADEVLTADTGAPMTAALAAPPASGAPDGVRSVTASDARYPDRVTLRWSAVGGATSYSIDRSTAPFGPADTIGTTAVAQFEDVTVVPGTMYYYTVYASNSAGDGPPSPLERGSALGAPTVEPSYDCDTGEIDLDWDIVPGAVSYRVYWDNEGDVSATAYAGLITASGTEVATDDVNAGAHYYFRGAAVNAFGEVGPLGNVRAVTVPAPLEGPGDLLGDYDPDLAANVLTWAPQLGATGYVVYWAASPGVDETSATLPPVSHPSIRHAAVHSGFRYAYRVRARDACGELGDLSDEITVAVP